MKLPLLAAALVLTQTPAAAPAPAGPSVLANGDFEKADPANPAKPAHWDMSDGTAVEWTNAPDPAHGKAIRMETDLSEQTVVASNAKAGLTQWVFPSPATSPIGETYGLSLYSEEYPVEPGKVYNVSFDYKCEKGTAGKLWMRGYAMVNGQEKRVYEGNVDCGGNAEWKTYTGVFHPTKHTPNVTKLKIMLYAYFPDGVAWYDNIKLTTSDDTDDDE